MLPGSSTAPGGARSPPAWASIPRLLFPVSVQLRLPTLFSPHRQAAMVRSIRWHMTPLAYLLVVIATGEFYAMLSLAICIHRVGYGSHPAGGCFASGNGQVVALRQSSSVRSTWCRQGAM